MLRHDLHYLAKRLGCSVGLVVWEGGDGYDRGLVRVAPYRVWLDEQATIHVTVSHSYRPNVVMPENLVEHYRAQGFPLSEIERRFHFFRVQGTEDYIALKDRQMEHMKVKQREHSDYEKRKQRKEDIGRFVSDSVDNTHKRAIRQPKVTPMRNAFPKSRLG